MNTPAIQVLDLSKRFGSTTVLQNLNLTIQAGSIVGLLGRNGAGKTTLIECLLGLRDPHSGGALLFGEDVKHLSEATKARIGYVPQTTQMFEWMTPREMLAYFEVFYSHWNATKVTDLMQRWALPWDQGISSLSIGQKQRLSIIRALAHEPELLVLDEPVSSLDPAGRREFLQELATQVFDAQTTVLFSTHILSDLERVAVDVAVLKDGAITLQQPLDELMDNTWRATGAMAIIQTMQAHRIFQTKPLPDGQARLLAQFSPQQRASMTAAPDLRLEQLSLEDLFIEITQ